MGKRAPFITAFDPTKELFIIFINIGEYATHESLFKMRFETSDINLVCNKLAGQRYIKDDAFPGPVRSWKAL